MNDIDLVNQIIYGIYDNQTKRNKKNMHNSYVSTVCAGVGDICSHSVTNSMFRYMYRKGN